MFRHVSIVWLDNLILLNHTILTGEKSRDHMTNARDMSTRDT